MAQLALPLELQIICGLEPSKILDLYKERYVVTEYCVCRTNAVEHFTKKQNKNNGVWLVNILIVPQQPYKSKALPGQITKIPHLYIHEVNMCYISTS